MPLPIVALLVAKLVGKVIQQRVAMTFKMQELAGQFVLGAYSALEGQDTDEALNQIDKVKIVINALIYIAGPPLLISVYGDKINSNRILYSYFAQFPRLREHLQAKEWGTIDYVDKITKEIAENVLKLYKIEKKDEEVEEFVDNPLALAQVIIEEIESLWQSFMEGDPFKFALHVSQSLVNADYPDELFKIPDWLARLMNPFIDLDFTVISSLIILLYSMDKSAFTLELEQIPRAWIKGMRGVLKADDRIIGESYVLKDGSIYFESKEFPLNFEKLEVDLHGFKYVIPLISFASKVKVTNLSKGYTIPGTDRRCQKIKLMLLPNLKYVQILGFEDRCYHPRVDWDYEDVQFFLFEEGDKYRIEIYGTYGGDHNIVEIQGIDKKIDCSPLRRDKPFDELPPSDELRAVIYLDKDTLEIVDYEIIKEYKG